MSTIKPNRYLGTSVALPAFVLEGIVNKEGTRREQEETADVEKYAWPGGYEIVYVFADGEDVCADCVRTLLRERTESLAVNRAGGWPESLADVPSLATGTRDGMSRAERHGLPIIGSVLFDETEVIAGFYNVGSVDSCTTCAQCSREIRVCEAEELPHTEHCSYFVGADD